MPRLSDALFKVGATAVDKLILGTNTLWANLQPPVLRAGSQTGSVTGLSETVNLPTGWQTGDCILVIINQNTAQAVTWTARVDSASKVADAGSFLQVWKIVPAAGANSVTFSVPASAVIRYWCGAWTGVDPNAAIAVAANNLGSNTTSVIEMPAVDLGYIATGAEVYVRAVGVNSSATFNTTANDVYITPSGNGALAVRSGQVPAGSLTSSASTVFDRGLAGSSRSESAVNLVLQPVQSPVHNLLTNGSFEAGGALATGWDQEFTAPRAATYAKATSGVIDGVSAQRMQFTGQAGDSGMVSMYQAPIAVNAGDKLTATVYLSGTLTNAYAIFGIEGFVTAGGAYISEVDTTVNAGALTGTPVQYTVSYTAPANCSAVAVYFQVPSLAATSVVDVYLDKAILTKS